MTLNLAIVVPGGVDRSGERRVVPLVLALLGQLTVRNSVHVFALKQEPRPAEWMLRGARIHNVGTRRGVHRVVRAILREHRARPFDVVHALWGGAGALSAALAARFARVPLLVHLAGGELVALHDIGYGMARRAHWRVLNRWVLAQAARVTAASAPMLELAAASGVRAQRVPLGIDVSTWPARDPEPRAAGEPARLIQVGSLNRVKDHATTLHALTALRARGVAFHADFIGEDTLRGEVQALAAALGVDDACRFHGFLTQDELRPLMERAHVNVISSRHEAGPAVALEAALAGVPTVGTHVGHLAEWSPTAARTVRVGDAPGLSVQIETLLGDDDLRLRVARDAQARALAEDARHTARLFERTYAEVARNFRTVPAS